MMKSKTLRSRFPVSVSLLIAKTMALFGVPTTRALANEDAKETIRPSFQGDIPPSSAMGRVRGPRTPTVAPLLMKFVRVAVIMLTPMISPLPSLNGPGSMPVIPVASQSPPPVTPSPTAMAEAAP